MVHPVTREEIVCFQWDPHDITRPAVFGVGTDVNHCEFLWMLFFELLVICLSIGHEIFVTLGVIQRLANDSMCRIVNAVPNTVVHRFYGIFFCKSKIKEFGVVVVVK